MVQPQLELIVSDTAIASLMTEDEARACVSEIKSHMGSARALLMNLYDHRGWQALGYPSWRACVVAEFEQSQAYLYRQLQAAEIEQRISPIGEIGAIPETHLRPLAALTPMEQPIAWQEVNERTNGKPTARVVEQVAREMLDQSAAIEGPENDVLDPPMEPAQAEDIRKGRVNAGLFTSATPEWYTPSHVIDRVIALFGEIDLDPCSNAKGAAANVPAGAHWTAEDNGIAQPWHGNVYMNPPYGDEISVWVARMVNAYEDGEIDGAIALLPARTDTAWFQPLLDYPICFVRGRLKFSGAENSAPFPSAVVYLGSDPQLFDDCFRSLGRIK
jgi:hypothetical protein